MVRRIGERYREENLKITAVATSIATAELARSLGVDVVELDDVNTLDINLDGADEIDPQFQMIKGRGGALLREKIVATASSRRVTMITTEKRVQNLGATMPIPVEVSPIGARHTERKIQELGAAARPFASVGDGSPYRTDGGNYIVDCRFASVTDPKALDLQLQILAGVLETGLFLDLCDTLIVGTVAGVDQIDNPRPRSDRS